jgi:hypothetical protein
MVKNNFKEFVSAGLGEAEFAHKQGENIQYNVYADSGIVYVKNRPYIISVMLESKNTDYHQAKEQAKQLMKAIGKESLEYISNYR